MVKFQSRNFAIVESYYAKMQVSWNVRFAPESGLSGDIG